METPLLPQPSAPPVEDASYITVVHALPFHDIVALEEQAPMLTPQNASASAQVKKWTWRPKLAICLLLVTIGIMLPLLMVPLKVHTDASTGNTSSGDSEMLLVGNSSSLSAHANSRRNWVCSWEWDLPDGSTKKNSDVRFEITSEVSKNTATAKCKNFFGQSLGSDEISLNLAVPKSSSVFIYNSSSSSVLKGCPLGSIITFDTSQDVSGLSAGSVVSSDTCGGFVIQLTSDVHPLTGKALCADASMEEVFRTLSTPAVAIPYAPITVTNASDIQQPTSSIALVPASKFVPAGSGASFINAQNWKLQFAHDILSGSALFHTLQWDVSTSLQSLTYNDGSFESVSWQASTTVLVDVVLTLALSSSGRIASYKTVLYSHNSPPEPVPLPLLDIVLVNALVDVGLELTVEASQLQEALSISYAFAAKLAFGWEMTCRKDSSSLCTASVLQSSASMQSTPTATITTASGDDVPPSLTMNGALIFGVGLQFDELVTLSDEVSVAITLSAQQSASNPSAPVCTTATLALSDAVTSNIRIFTKNIDTLFKLPVYTAAQVVVLQDGCTPTARPSTVPTHRPSLRPTYNPTPAPTCSGYTNRMSGTSIVMGGKGCCGAEGPTGTCGCTEGACNNGCILDKDGTVSDLLSGKKFTGCYWNAVPAGAQKTVWGTQIPEDTICYNLHLSFNGHEIYIDMNTGLTMGDGYQCTYDQGGCEAYTALCSTTAFADGWDCYNAVYGAAA